MARKLRKLKVFQQKLNRKKKLIVAIMSSPDWLCNYPDPDACQNYDPKTGCCMDTKITCSYRRKCK